MKAIIILLISIFITVKMSNAQEINITKKTNPFTGITSNMKKSYTGRNLLYHLGGIGVTYVIVNSGTDAKMLRATSRINSGLADRAGFAGIMTGYITPVVLPVSMYLAGRNDHDLRNASFAVMQSLGIAVAANTLLKSITGRTPPDPDHPDKYKLSRQFRFGFMRGGAHYGWPSGHLMTNMAMVSALTSYYPEKTWLRMASIAYIGTIAACVMIDERGRAHWLSEVIAGGLMGYAIGSTVGNEFNKYREQKSEQKSEAGNSRVSWYPFIGRNVKGLTLNINF